MSDGFLSRWSRRKRREEPTASDAAAPEAVAPETVGAGAEAEAGTADDVLSPEELAELPSIDALTAQTDVTAFLRKGVPLALRNAALRRAWTVDPQVRDFVCEAREYAYDWNVPGGVPGNGDLLPTDDVAGMLRRIFNDQPEQVAPVDPPSEVAGAVPDRPDLCDPVSQPTEDRPVGEGENGESAPGFGDDAPQHGSAVPAMAGNEDATRFEENTPGPSSLALIDRSAALQPDRVEAIAAAPAPKRRHGGAAPI